MRRFFLSILCITSVFGASAQMGNSVPPINKGDFLQMDARAARTGPMEGHVVKAILNELLDTSWTKLEKMRAIYMWEIANIGFDCWAYHHPNDFASNASVALNERMTTSKGYAEFFKAMCDVSGIECMVVQGLLRTDPEKIGKLENNNRHYWNVVKINNVYYLVDATLGAGTTDSHKRRFTKALTDAWWLPNRELFAMSHFPDKKQWQLLEKPVTKSEFVQAPIVDPQAFLLGVIPPAGAKGMLRGREDTTIVMNYRLQRPDDVRKVSMSVDDGNQVVVEYFPGGNGMSVIIPYTKAGKQLYSLYVNDKKVLTYNVQVRPYKRPKPRVIPTKTA